MHFLAIFRFIFRFRPKKSCFLFFVYFSAERIFFTFGGFTFSAENGKIIFSRPLHDTARHWSKTENFSYPTVEGDPNKISSCCLMWRKHECPRQSVVNKVNYYISAILTQTTDVTDIMWCHGQTDKQTNRIMIAYTAPAQNQAVNN